MKFVASGVSGAGPDGCYTIPECYDATKLAAETADNKACCDSMKFAKDDPKGTLQHTNPNRPPSRMPVRVFPFGFSANFWPVHIEQLLELFDIIHKNLNRLNRGVLPPPPAGEAAVSAHVFH